MIAVDTNILIYAHRADALHHKDGECGKTSGRRIGAVGDPWPRVSFVRFSTNPRILRPPSLGGKLAGAQVHDARIHAICIASGVRELWSANRTFRMPRPPLVKSCR